MMTETEVIIRDILDGAPQPLNDKDVLLEVKRRVGGKANPLAVIKEILEFRGRSDGSIHMTYNGCELRPRLIEGAWVWAPAAD